jgi:hypothetical protein
MALRQDLKQINNDVTFLNGDFIIINSDTQHVEDMINSYQGWWKQYPITGVGIQSFLGSPSNDQVIIRQIKIQLQNDFYSSTPSIERDFEGKINIFPNAINNYV